MGRGPRGYRGRSSGCLILAGLLLLPVVAVALTTVTIWTHPVLVAIERYGESISHSYGGPVAGIAKEGSISVTLTVIDDLDPAMFADARADGLSCETATTFICRRAGAAQNTGVSNVKTWRGAGNGYCVAVCSGLDNTYAFVAVIGAEGE